MTQVSYPGVYIQEVPSGVRTIAPVSTSICAFIDFFREGPMNEAVEIDGKAGFDRIFGGLEKRSEASYAIDQFFTNGGTKACVVRVASGAPTAATATVKTHPGLGTAAAQVDLMRISALSQGAWGNTVRARVSHNADGSFNLAAARHQSADADAPVMAAEPPFLNLSIDPASPRHFPKVINDASSLVRVSHLVPADTRLPASNGTLGKLISLSATAMAALHPTNKTFTVRVVTPSATEADPTVDHTATLDFAAATSESPPPTTPKALRGKLEAAIQTAKDAQNTTHPLLAGATVDLIETAAGYRFLVEPNRRAREFAPHLVLTITNATGSTAAEQLGFTGQGTSENVQDYLLGINGAVSQGTGTAGADGTLPDATALKGAPGEPPTGMYALNKVDLFNLLCIPRAADLTDAQADALIGDALTFCEEHRAMLLIDIPADRNTVQEIKDWIDDNATYRHKNSVLYFPRIKVADPLDEFRLRSIGAAGTMAGIYARTDATRGVWKAPAGLEAKLRGVSELDFKLTDPENGSLNPIAVNALRVFPIHGQVVWGARTLDGADEAASEWKYINIRRTALMIEESLFRGTKWVTFEGNDEPTWAKIRQNVGAFMMSLFRQGAFQGSTPDKAFYVKCDGETTTANDRNLGIVNIEVGFAPLKPAEFVVIKIQQIPDV